MRIGYPAGRLRDQPTGYAHGVARDLRGAVVVITGASSGIGRAAALAFAREGSRLALAARGEAPLREIAAQCTELGAEAIAVPTDVRDDAAVEQLAETTSRHFG